MPLDLSVDLAPGRRPGLLLSNPVMTASGTFGYGMEYGELFDIHKLGAIVCKGTTLEPREGNPQPRLFETSSGIINSIGLQNVGVQALVRDKSPVWSEWKTPVIVNIAGNILEDYVKLAEELDCVPGVSGIEINVSCPNVKAGGAAFGAYPDSAAAVTAGVRAATSLPLLVKLTPNTADIASVAVAVAKAGADALTVMNAPKGLAIDVERRRPVLGNIIGGLSGPAIKPIALAMVYQVAGAVKLPIVGVGGITKATDAIEFFMAGASAVQVASATFNNPRASLEVLEGIEQYMIKEGIGSLAGLIGAARL